MEYFIILFERQNTIVGQRVQMEKSMARNHEFLKTL